MSVHFENLSQFRIGRETNRFELFMIHNYLDIYQRNTIFSSRFQYGELYFHFFYQAEIDHYSYCIMEST